MRLSPLRPRRRSLSRIIAAAALIWAGSLRAEPEAGGVQVASWPALDPDQSLTLAWQLALESWGFSPGLLDGRLGARTRMAIAAAQSAMGAEPTAELDARCAEALGVDERQNLTTCRLSEDDARDVETPSDDWNERARRTRLRHYSLLDLVKERHHCSRGLLEALNPGVALDALLPGDLLFVPATRAFAHRQSLQPTALEICLEEKYILVLREDAAGQRFLLGLLHCSVAADLEQAPRGELKVETKAENPGYTFDPAKWPEVHNVTRKLSIPPGPRNPVGLIWIGLDRPGYGIHGTPDPDEIGRTGSHGCFRLANWDASWLGRSAPIGLPVRIRRESREMSWSWRQ
jgi:hypothetical protein